MTYRYKKRRYIVNADGSLERDSDGDIIGGDRWHAKQAARKRLDAEEMRKRVEAKNSASAAEAEKKVGP